MSNKQGSSASILSISLRAVARTKSEMGEMGAKALRSRPSEAVRVEHGSEGGACMAAGGQSTIKGTREHGNQHGTWEHGNMGHHKGAVSPARFLL